MLELTSRASQIMVSEACGGNIVTGYILMLCLVDPYFLMTKTMQKIMTWIHTLPDRILLFSGGFVITHPAAAVVDKIMG